MILGWAVEDAMLEIFNDQLGLTTSLNSADKTREFLKTPKASSDFIIFHENQEYFVEIVSDYNGFWKRTLLCHLRDNKFLNVKAEDGIIFGNDYKNNRCIILKANSIEEDRILWKEKHDAYGGKPAYEITLKMSVFYPIGDIFRFI